MYTSTVTPVFTRVSKQTLRGQIAERIREAILNGSLRSGERIVERKLAEQFGASLTAVREALITLESEGFVLKKPNSSTYVTEYSQETIKKAYQLRRVLESYAIAEAIRRATPEQIDRVSERYMEMVEVAGRGDQRLFFQKDFDWHASIWELSDNEFLVSALRRLVLPLFAFSTIRLQSGKPLDLLEDAYKHHPIMEAFRAKDLERCLKAFDYAIDEWQTLILAWGLNNK